MEPIRIREAIPSDAPGMARVHVESWRTTYTGIIPKAPLARRLSVKKRKTQWIGVLNDPDTVGFHHVAETPSGDIVGFASGGPERRSDPDYPGELYGIYLLQSHQRQGVGRRLVAATARCLHLKGMSSMLVWVLADNPSRRFYEALGGQPLYEAPYEIGGITLTQVAYGWRDTRPLWENMSPHSSTAESE